MRTINLSNNPEHHDNFHLVYRRPLQPKGNSVWEFCGYRCLNCDRVIKNDNTVPKHKLNCKPYVRGFKLDPDPSIIINNRREPWVPLEMNQNPPDPDSIDFHNDK